VSTAVSITDDEQWIACAWSISGVEGNRRRRHAGLQSDERARVIDELRLVVYPIVLGKGKALFKDVKERHALTSLGAKALKSGLVRLTYST
jgi:hypothetical protein